jgi:2-polyprenyl-3-methyl-5-hydroxy-6-metoxy-1,4-benzoquinol methylase
MAVDFDKYKVDGAIHWAQTNRMGLKYNAPLVSRYSSVLKRVPLNARIVLDIGCGDGYLSCQMARRLPRAHIIGIDADSVGIEFARQKALENGLANVRFMVSKSDTLPFAPNDFDVTLMTDVIEHLPRPGDLLAEIVRVLKPGGVAIITTPNRQDASKWDERHDREYTGPELSSELAAYFLSVQIFGTWPMKAVIAWKAKGFGRIYLDLAARLGFNHFEAETPNPSSDYGQLTAVCGDGIVALS